MLRTLNLSPKDRVVEIGPGPGALTFPLLERLPQLDVIEIDRDVIAWWQQQPQAQGKLTIHALDALKLDIQSLRGEAEPLRIIGNLPYNISTPLLFHLLEQGKHIRDMLFMLQKEVVDRIVAAPNSKDYGRLSVMIQYYCKPEFLFEVPPGAFNPPPKVTSAVFRLTPYVQKPVVAKDEKNFANLVGHVFTQRRKTLRNSLKGRLDEKGIIATGIDPMARPENLSMAQFVMLSDACVQTAAE